MGSVVFCKNSPKTPRERGLAEFNQFITDTNMATCRVSSLSLIALQFARLNREAILSKLTADQERENVPKSSIPSLQAAAEAAVGNTGRKT